MAAGDDIGKKRKTPRVDLAIAGLIPRALLLLLTRRRPQQALLGRLQYEQRSALTRHVVHLGRAHRADMLACLKPFAGEDRRKRSARRSDNVRTLDHLAWALARHDLEPQAIGHLAREALTVALRGAEHLDE